MPVLKRNNKPDLYYEIDDYTDPWRNAPFILLQHGFGRSSKFWYRCVPSFSRFYKVIRPDLRGFGRSSKDFDLENDVRIEEYLDDLEAILDEVGAESVHYGGDGLGGFLGTILAAERPRRVRTLNLISVRVYLNEASKDRFKFGHNSTEEALRKIGSKGYAEAKNTSDRFSPDTDPGLVQWFAQEQGASNVEVMIAVQKFAATLDTTPYLSRIAAPVLVINPSHGPITTAEQTDVLRKHVKNLKMVHLPSKYHNLHLTQAAACATQVLHFAAQHDGVTCHEA